MHGQHQQTMKSITSLSASALVVVALILLSSSGEVESFASPSRRVSKVITSKSKQVHHHPKLSLGLPSSTTNRPSFSTAPLFAILNDDDDEEVTDDVTPTRTAPSRRSRILSTLRQKSKPITLAILTSASTFFLPSFLLPPAKASAPIVLRANKKKDDPPMMQADKKAAELKKQKSLEEFDAFMAKANDIEISQGKAARDAYEKQYQIDKLEKEAQKELDIQLLKQQLLDEGKDYHTDLDAERQVYQLEHDIDLEKISGTPQNELMIKNFQSRNKKKKGTEEASSYKQHQRYIIQCQVLDLKSRGINPLEHFEQSDVIDKTRAIYKMDDKVAAKVAKQYEQLMVQYDGRLTPPKEGEVPFEYTTGVVADMVNDKGGVKALGGSASDKKKEERAALKAKRAAEKEVLRKQKQEAKAQRAEAKAAAKKERAAAKEQQSAEKAAAAAVASASASSSSTALVSMDDGDVASTANGDISASAGNNAVSIPSSEEVATTKSKASSSDLLSQIKQQTTPKNVATVVITGGAAAYGFNYYKENNAAAISEREKQLKLILGNDLDEEDDDDEFDDDEEDDDYEQFTKKRKTPEPAKPKPAEEPKASTKPPSPPPVPTQPSPTPPKPRRLGIFSKRNANARETDLNALVSPSAQAPEFATLLAQILTFGAPGRFPSILSWGAPMPFTTFDLEEAKSLLTTSRQDVDLTDEQSAEIFASVVNCMIIDIVDLASIALKSKDKDEKVAVDAINVVMDFMDHAASLFDAVAEDVTIKPVTYGGKLRKKDLEQMFSVYAGSSMMSLDALAGGGGTSQDRVDTLQLVFAIPDKKAEGLMQKHMMKMMMNLMKDGGKGLDGMLPEGMEGMEEMMAAMGGGGMLPGMDGGEMNPEDLKQTVSMMKDLMDSGQVSEEELVEVRKQFREMYGSDIGDLIKKADAEGAGEGMTSDERELLDMFKQILGE